MPLASAPPPAPPPPAAVSATFFKTAQSTRPEWMVLAGGSFFRTRTLATSAALVRHPMGSILWDTGFRKESPREVDEHALSY